MCLNKHHDLRTYWGGVIAPWILDLGTRRRWVVASRPSHFTVGGESPTYQLDRRLGGTQSRSGRGGEERNSRLCRESNLRIPIVQLVIYTKFQGEVWRVVTPWNVAVGCQHFRGPCCLHHQGEFLLKPLKFIIPSHPTMLCYITDEL
jgi:hypothetical protein